MNNKKIHITRKIALGIASAAALFLTTGIGAWAYATPYSYVSLDVNPSIEYTLNRFNRVIDVKAINDDGQVIISQINISGLNNQSIESAIIATVKQISQDGYFATAVTGSAIVVDGDVESNSNEEAVDSVVVTGPAISVEDGTSMEDVISIDGGIVITIAKGNGEISEELAKEIRELVETLVGNDVEVEVESVGYERVQKAKELGVTPGKLNLVEKLVASSNDPDSIVIEEWLNKPVKDIMKAIKVNKKSNIKEKDQIVDSKEDLAEIEDTLLDVLVESVELTIDEQEKAEDLKEEQENTEDKGKEDLEKAANKAKIANNKIKKVEEKEKKPKEKVKEENSNSEKKEKEEIERVTEKAKKAEEKAKEAQMKAEEKAKEAQIKAEEKARKAQEKADEKTAVAEEKLKEAEELVKDQKGKSEMKDSTNKTKATNGSGNKKGGN